ncbi:MAG: hypothetical protein Q8909_14625, partial [Bacteroidota bacterium]|nr:hypothetical protein [Bacteroidota bacterium]
YKKVITERPNSQRVPLSRPSGEQKERLNLTFYPEGGNLVAGLTSKVAFKAIDKEGGNAPVSGIVVDAQGNKVAEFETGYQGMGVFDFTPGAGKYIAKAQYQGKEYSFELPTALPAGYVVSVDNSDAEKMGFVVQRSSALKGDALGLTISCRGKVYASDQLDMTQDSVQQLMIPKKILPSGVIQLTLFNANGEILGERLAFVNHFSQMKITSTQDKPAYNPFERVNMDFRLNDLKGNPVEATFSVAVRDAATNSTNPYSDNVLTNLLLSSELKGYIENPGFYFESDDATRRQALDLLMLTQGWSRYVWKQMAGVTPFDAKQPIEDGLYIQGSVQSLYSKKKIENIDLSMTLLADSTSQRGKCLTDKEGKFTFALRDFQGQGKLILQTKQDGKKKEKRILLDRVFNPDLRVYFYPELHVQEFVRAVRDTVITQVDSIDIKKKNTIRYNDRKLPMDKRNYLLNEVTVKGKKKAYPPFKISTEYNVSKEMDKIKDVGDWEPANLAIMLDHISKYFRYEPPCICYYKGKSVIFLSDKSPLILKDLNAIISEDYGSQATQTNVNGVAVESNTTNDNKMIRQQSYLPDLDAVESVSIIEDPIAKYRLLPSEVDLYKYVIILLHYKKDYIKEPYGIRNTTFQGYSYTKEFFQPNYEKALLPDEKDYRRTLYWNPDVKTDANGKATISFFNNGSCKAMNVSAETVTDRGVIGAMCK